MLFFDPPKAKPGFPMPVEPSYRPEAGPKPTFPGCFEDKVIFPPGLLGEVANYILASAPYPADGIALAGAIGFLSGICGRSYNVQGAGLNQYILVLAGTGMGKDSISSGTSRLLAAVQKSVPAAADFRGPGELVSSAGLIKWLDRKPSVISIIGEFGLKLKEMSMPNANANAISLQRSLLQLYTKSGHGETYDPMAYSDKDKNTGAIRSPSLTIVGESVPETFFELLDERVISSGLLPRFMVVEYRGVRPYRNLNSSIEPSSQLVQQLAALIAHSLHVGNSGQCIEVALDNAAGESFSAFDRWTTDLINETTSDVHRQLWNRANLKALKLAAVCAVGENYAAPYVSIDAAMWAISIIVYQTENLIRRFATGEVGEVGGNERKQIDEVMRVMWEYANSPHSRYEKYNGSAEMRDDFVITKAHIMQRLCGTAAFKQDRNGPTVAIKRSLKHLLEDDTIRQVPKPQMQERYGCMPEAYILVDVARIKGNH